MGCPAASSAGTHWMSGAHLPSCDNQVCPQILSDVLQWAKSPQLRTIALGGWRKGMLLALLKELNSDSKSSDLLPNFDKNVSLALESSYQN